MDSREIIILIFGFIFLIMVANIFKVIINFFSNRRRYEEIYEIRRDVNSRVRPHLNSLERKFTSEDGDEKFDKYVFGVFRDRFKGRSENIVKREISRCCSEYESADLSREDYWLAGSGRLIPLVKNWINLLGPGNHFPRA